MDRIEDPAEEPFVTAMSHVAFEDALPLWPEGAAARFRVLAGEATRADPAWTAAFLAWTTACTARRGRSWPRSCGAPTTPDFGGRRRARRHAVRAGPGRVAAARAAWSHPRGAPPGCLRVRGLSDAAYGLVPLVEDARRGVWPFPVPEVSARTASG